MIADRSKHVPNKVLITQMSASKYLKIKCNNLWCTISILV